MSVPANTQTIALLRVLNVVTIVSDHDRFVCIRHRLAITIFVNVRVLNSDSPNPLADSIQRGADTYRNKTGKIDDYYLNEKSLEDYPL